jgi:hypothetical protein
MTKEYTVTITDKYPAAGERPSQVWVKARNKREAIAQVRKAGWRSRYDSPVIYTAEEE